MSGKLTDFGKGDLVSIIVHGKGDLGRMLTKLLSAHGSKVIVIGDYTSGSDKIIQQFKSYGDVDFIDFTGLDGLFKTIPKIDYLFYLLNDYLDDPDTEFDSTSFIRESNYLETAFNASLKFDIKSALISSARVHKNMYQMSSASTDSKYSPEALQKYAESTIAEKFDKYKIKTRILRLGTPIGDITHLNDDPVLARMIADLLKRHRIEIPGDGLDTHFLVDIKDAVKGIVQLTFNNDLTGEVITLANDEQYTTLSLAYKLLELIPTQATIKFVQSESPEKIRKEKYIPAPNATEFHWKPSSTLTESLSKTLTAMKGRRAHDKKTRKIRQPLQKGQAKPLRHIQNPHKHTRKIRKRKNATLLGVVLLKVSKLIRLLKGAWQTTRIIFSRRNIIPVVFWLIFLLPIFYFLLFPLLRIGIYSGRIYLRRDILKQNLATRDFDALNTNLHTSCLDITQIQNGTSQLYWLFKFMDKDPLYQNTQILLSSLQSSCKSGESLSAGMTPYIRYIDKFQPALDINDPRPHNQIAYHQELVDMQEASQSFNDSLLSLQYSDELLSQLEINQFPGPLREKIVNYRAFHHKTAKDIKPLLVFLPRVPDILGINGRKRYIILLQNPSELRSTGGWISSLVVIGMEDGQLREFYVDDVYNVNGNLLKNGYVNEPPKEMQEALNIDSWDMSLANWDPDYPTTSRTVTKFARQASIAPRVNGVVAIDITFLQMIIHKWGGVPLGKDGEIITADNLYDKIFKIHRNFKPGEQYKTDFLSDLSREVVNGLLTSKYASYKENFDVINEALQQKHILVHFKNSRNNELFADTGWDGHLNKKYSYTPFSIEWNWGGNKANLFIKRKQKLYIDISNPNEITYTYKTILRNDSQVDHYPEGPYTDVHRIYINKDAKILKISGFDTQKILLNYDKGIFHVSGGYVYVPVKSTATIKYQAKLIRKEGTYFPISKHDRNYTLDLQLFKQPGTFADIYEVEITYPKTWILDDLGSFQKTSDNTMRLITTQKTDIPIHVSWSY